ncbi:hypothetical protein TNCV_3057081 [Trichonephila clavipes]|nr:hypothetical protein TNCV_3057081 [Trichonephila clavipes]
MFSIKKKPTHFTKGQTGPTTGIMVWGGIMFDHRSPLVHIDGHFTADRNAIQVGEPVVLPLMQGAPYMIFQQVNVRPHVARGHPLLAGNLTKFKSHRTPVRFHWT